MFTFAPLAPLKLSMPAMVTAPDAHHTTGLARSFSDVKTTVTPPFSSDQSVPATPYTAEKPALCRPTRQSASFARFARFAPTTFRASAWGEKAVWQMLREYAEPAGVPHRAARSPNMREMCRAAGGELEQIQMLLGRRPFRRPSGTLVRSRI